VLDNPRQVTPAGLNLAIRAARGRIIVRMDAHTEYAPDYIVRCVEILQQTGADNVGGPARIKAEGYLQRAVGAAHSSSFSTGGSAFHRTDYEGEVDTVFYGCWHKSKLLEIGMFDEELVRNQDDELNYRIKQAGGRLWQSPAIRCWYRPRNSLIALFHQYRQYGFWKVRVIQKQARPASWRHVVPIVLLLGVSICLLAGFVEPVFWIAAAAAIAGYGVLNVAYSVRTAASAGWDLFPILPVVFLTYHVGYGVGFSTGLVHFVVARPLACASTSESAGKVPSDVTRARAA